MNYYDKTINNPNQTAIVHGCLFNEVMTHYPYSGIIPNVRIWKQKSKLDDADKDWILANVHYLNLREMAEYVDCSVTTVYRFLESKGIHRETKRAVWK